MKSTVQSPAQGRRVDFQFRFETADVEAKGSPGFAPARLRPVVEGEIHLVASVAHPIHHAQGGSGEPAFQEVVFDDDSLFGNACGFGQQGCGLLAVVEDIHQQNPINAFVIPGNALSVENLDGNPGLRTDQDIHSPDRELRVALAEFQDERPIPAADIEDRTPAWEKMFEVFTQNGDSSSAEVGGVNPLRDIHRRPIPSMLTKKLERIPWMPRAARVTPGITCRRVDA